jgi:hypothetical protein
MADEIEEVCKALDNLAAAVISAWGADSTACENFGWFAPAVTRHELAEIAKTLAVDIRSTEGVTPPSTAMKLIQDLPRRLQVLQSNTVPQMFGGNGGQAIPAYLSTIAIIRATLLPQLSWQVIPDIKALPSNLARRVRAAQAELDQLLPNLGNLSSKISDIESAHKIADSLPIDLQTLAEAREKLNKSATEAALTAGKIEDAWGTSLEYRDFMKGHNEEAAKLIQQCEAAYQITTTKGLAAAFDQRASNLASSVWAWVAGLVTALCLGSYIGSQRLEILSAALIAPSPNWGGIAIQAILSLLSVGAPLWFAWLATKQIGQRFRLAEDYAFKASVAKAYEGYRKEAARIDPAFEHRLFDSALNRLDEAPLRLVESGTHGSPWHELANSEAARRAFSAMPELQDRLSTLLRDGIKATGKVMSKPEVAEKATQDTKAQ